MMCDPLTTPAEAASPDADRRGSDASAHLPDWLVHLIARLILFLLESLLPVRPRRSSAVPSWLHDRPDLPPGSAQAEAASIRGPFGNVIVWMCRSRGIGPGHPDWPELSRAIVAFGGSTKGFRPGLPACGLQWWQNPDIVPGMIGETPARPAAEAMALLLSRTAAADIPRSAPSAMQAEAAHARLPASWRSASGWHVFARAGPGPPTGRTLPGTANTCNA